MRTLTFLVPFRWPNKVYIAQICPSPKDGSMRVR